MNSKITRRRSAIHGNGVFAKEAIGKGEHVAQYTGRLISHDEADELHHGDLMSGHTFLFTLNDHWIVDANVRGGVAKWINHSCSPNCVAFVHEDDSKDPSKERIIIEALRKIAPGEEITYDYGFEFDVPYTKELKRIWGCRCGSKDCTGTMLKEKRKEEKGKKKSEKGKRKKEKEEKGVKVEKKVKKESKDKRGGKKKKGKRSGKAGASKNK